MLAIAQTNLLKKDITANAFLVIVIISSSSSSSSSGGGSGASGSDINSTSSK